MLTAFASLQYKRNEEAQLRLSIPELKLITVFVYFTILGLIALSYYSVGRRENMIMSDSFQEYFRCESLGIPNACSRPIQEWTLVPFLIGYVLQSFLSGVNLIYVINWRKAKLLVLRCWKTLRERDSYRHSFADEITGQIHSLTIVQVVTPPIVQHDPQNTIRYQPQLT